MSGGSRDRPQAPSAVADLLQIPDTIRQVAAFIVSALWIVLCGVCLWRMASQIAVWLRRQLNDLDGAEVGRCGGPSGRTCGGC